MEQKIQEQLRQLEQKKDIKVLLACETGSRAWGFPSPDSDYDVRMIFAHRKDWYISLQDSRDTIELMLENRELDITGWDVRKSLRLLRKSNVALLERLQSPIVYQSDPGFVEDILPLAEACYAPVACMYHYLSMGKRFFEEMERLEEVKLKKLFYALRTAAACQWIMEQERMVPIVFQHVMEGVMNASMQAHVNELIALKATKSEQYMHPADQRVMSYIREQLNRAEQAAPNLRAGQADLEALNQLLRTTVNRFV